MCTAATFKTKDFYFGRTLDYEFSYGEEIVIMPRKFTLKFTENDTLCEHYAIIGSAHVSQGYPLFYDAVNEKGLAAAGLNFPEKITLLSLNFCRTFSQNVRALRKQRNCLKTLILPKHSLPKNFLLQSCIGLLPTKPALLQWNLHKTGLKFTIILHKCLQTNRRLICKCSG